MYLSKLAKYFKVNPPSIYSRFKKLGITRKKTFKHLQLDPILVAKYEVKLENLSRHYDVIYLLNLIESSEYKFLFLPLYSPQLNDIEHYELYLKEKFEAHLYLKIIPIFKIKFLVSFP